MARYPASTEGDAGFEGFPAGWEDSSIVSRIKRNRDGSITVRIQIDVQGDEGGEHVHFQTFRVLRLQRSKD